jgi:hypothetical protein
MKEEASKSIESTFDGGLNKVMSAKTASFSELNTSMEEQNRNTDKAVESNMNYLEYLLLDRHVGKPSFERNEKIFKILKPIVGIGSFIFNAMTKIIIIMVVSLFTKKQFEYEFFGSRLWSIISFVGGIFTMFVILITIINDPMKTLKTILQLSTAIGIIWGGYILYHRTKNKLNSLDTVDTDHIKEHREQLAIEKDEQKLLAHKEKLLLENKGNKEKGNEILLLGYNSYMEVKDFVISDKQKEVEGFYSNFENDLKSRDYITQDDLLFITEKVNEKIDICNQIKEAQNKKN